MGYFFPKINTDHLKQFKEDTLRIPHRITREPQCKRPHKETGPCPSVTPVDLTITTSHEKPPPSPPSSPIDLSIGLKHSPATRSSPLSSMKMPPYSPVSHTTTMVTEVPTHTTDAAHSCKC